MTPHLGAKGVSSSTDVKTSSIVRGRGFSRSIGMGLATTGLQRSSLKPLHWSKVTRVLQGSLWEELQRCGDSERYYNFFYEFRLLFHSIVISSDSNSVVWPRCNVFLYTSAFSILCNNQASTFFLVHQNLMYLSWRRFSL